MIRGAVFDLDGTLANTPTAISRLLVDVAAELGVTVTPEQAAPTIGKPLEPSLAALLGCAVDDPRTVRATDRYRALFDQEVLSQGADLLFPGVGQGLRALQSQGIHLAVATSKISPSAEKLLTATGLRDLFGPVIGNDMVRRGKPDPEMGLRAAAELHIAPQDCAYIGDTVTDLRMARAAGMVPIAVTYGVDSPNALAHHTQWLLSTFPDVVHTLTDLAATTARERQCLKDSS
ncbi:MAG TPA: HAD family hydrolase [Streptomyces sp.]